MALPKTPFLPADGKIAISDNTGTPIVLTIAYEDGDLQITGLKSGFKTTQVFKNRGKHYSVRKVEHQAVAFSFTAHATGIIDAADGSIPAALLGLAGTPWATPVTTAPANTGDGDLRQLKWTGERTDFGGTADTTITLKYCDCEFDFAEGVPGKFSVKGEAYILAGDAVAFT